MSVLDTAPARAQAHAEKAAPLQVFLHADAGPVKAPKAEPARAAARPSAAPLRRHYYNTSELDVRPGIMVHVEPRYPERAAQDGVTGRVVTQLFLREDGSVEHVSIIRAEPVGYFEYAVEQAFMGARFTPGLKGGEAVKVQMALEVNFGGETK
jgi:TonB family protein